MKRLSFKPTRITASGTLVVFTLASCATATDALSPQDKQYTLNMAAVVALAEQCGVKNTDAFRTGFTKYMATEQQVGEAGTNYISGAFIDADTFLTRELADPARKEEICTQDRTDELEKIIENGLKGDFPPQG